MEKPYEIDSEGNVIWLRDGGDLLGAPKKVKGYFNCVSCELSSLEEGPIEVGSHYYCYGNRNLKSLKGVATIIKGSFICSFCGLQSLEGGPLEVEGVYDCQNNSLRSLKGICKAKNYMLPEGFTLKDVEKELKRQEMFRGMSEEEADLLDVLF